MNENRRNYLIPLRVAAVLLVLVMMTTGLVTGRYARYTSSDSGADSARIAAYVFDVRDTDGHIVDLTKIQTPGDNEAVTFVVSNHRGDVVSEVEETYVLTIQMQSSLPLTCTLTGGNKTITLTDMGGIDTDGRAFEAAVKSDVTYTLQVEWDGAKNDIEYSRAGIAALVLNVNAQQVD